MPQQLPLLSEDRPTYTTQRDETERAGFRDAWPAATMPSSSL